MTDVELLRRARRGDQSAFAQLFNQYARPIYRYAAYMCGRIVADDIVQETFLAVLQQRERSDVPERAVVSYLLGIARHRILKRASRGEVWHSNDAPDGDGVWADPRQATPLEEFARLESIEQVRAAVESLPAPFREAVVLCELQEFDYVSAAAVVGCPVGTIRSRLHRGKAMLAVKLRRMRDDSRT